jgi:hypothetical protein
LGDNNEGKFCFTDGEELHGDDVDGIALLDARASFLQKMLVSLSRTGNAKFAT